MFWCASPITYCLPENSLSFSLFTVYLNVTDLTSYKVGWDTFCIRWSPHRSATSYRLKLNPADGKCILFFAFSGNIIVLFQCQHHLFGLLASTHQKPQYIWLSFKALDITCFSTVVKKLQRGSAAYCQVNFHYWDPASYLGFTCTLLCYSPVCFRVHNHHIILV